MFYALWHHVSSSTMLVVLLDADLMVEATVQTQLRDAMLATTRL